MLPDEELCLCFHVTKRKVVNFLRVEKPRVASQMSECHGAGTGCGWCRPFLLKLWEAHKAGTIARPTDAVTETAEVSIVIGRDDMQLPSAEDYAKQRAAYVKSGAGTPPPGATPVE